jgi:hypothetical protein
MSEELVGYISVYRRRFPKLIGYYALLFTSKRIIVAKTLSPWIKEFLFEASLSPLYAKGASYILMRRYLEKRRHRERMKTLPFDKVLGIDKENFEISYLDIREVKLYRRFHEYKISIKLNETRNVYNLMAKRTEIIESLNPFLHWVLGEKFRAEL